MTCVCQFGHFFHFLAKTLFYNLIPTPTSPPGVKVVKDDFSLQIIHFMPLTKISFLEFDPLSHPHGWRFGKDYFSVQIWTFHPIPSKKFLLPT